MQIDLSEREMEKYMAKLKINKASGPDKVTPKFLKVAGEAVIASLASIYRISVTRNSVPAKWKEANISALHEGDDETDMQNYKPISLLSAS